MTTIAQIEKELVTKLAEKNNNACPRIGDRVAVKFEIVEGEKSRVKTFEGLVIAIKNGGNRTTFTVRKESLGTGVERIFPLHSPFLKDIIIKKHHKVRRAKLYYQRDLSGKKARLKQVFRK
jgi:large subunit ribosomal protein L19